MQENPQERRLDRMQVDLISALSGEKFGGVERYAINLLTQFASIQTGHSFRLVNFPASVASRLPFKRVTVEYRLRDTVSHLVSKQGPRFVASTIDYLATNSIAHSLGDLVSGWNRQLGVSFGLEALGRSGIIHGLTHFLPRFARTTPSVVTVHDVGPLRMPQLYPQSYVWYMRREFARQVQSCEKVIAVSPFTLREVREWYHVPQERLVLVPHGIEETFRPVDPAAVLRRHRIPTPYIYYPMGTIEPRKNLAAVSEAVRHVRAELRTNLTLVITGRSLAVFREVEQTISDGVSAGYLRTLGFVDPADLPSLYSGAELCVYPSLYEGFGLPVLEAMACGTPVAISRIEPLEYVAGEAGYRFESSSSESVAEGLVAMLSDPGLRSRLSEAGLHRAREFSWEDTARRTLEVYDSLT